jgi:hypothetical protein
MKIPLPDWVIALPDGPEKERAIDRFFLQIVCAYASREGNIRVLADLLDVNYQTLKSQVSNCKTHSLSWGVIQKIETLLGATFRRQHDFLEL